MSFSVHTDRQVSKYDVISPPTVKKMPEHYFPSLWMEIGLVGACTVLEGTCQYKVLFSIYLDHLDQGCKNVFFRFIEKPETSKV